MTLSIDHVAIAVRPGELERQVELYKQLGFVELYREEVLGADQVREVLLQVGDSGDRIQLLEPLSPESPVAKQVERGVAHVAYRVADIRQAFDHMKQEGFRIVDSEPRPGSGGSTVFFVHPKTTDALSLGYLIEIVQSQVLPD